MSFIASAQPATSTPPATVANDGFFPDIDLAHARDTLRLDGTVTDARLAHAITGALLELANDLAGWKAAQQALGYETLAAVPGDQIAGKTRQAHAYLRAVYCLVKADLIERMADYDATGAGQKRSDRQEESPDEQRRNARWAVADIQGLRRTVVELI